jgi:hypothetical protein
MTMLNHQPFRDWLFSEEPLDAQDTLLLQEHLRTCEECQRQRQAWNGALHFIQNTREVSPAEGFLNRWQERLTAQRLRRQHKLAWVFFGAAAGLALITLTILGWQVFEALRAPQNLLLFLFLRVASFITIVDSISDYLSIFRALLPSLPVVGLVLFVGFISMISVLWLATYKRLSAVRRIIE